LGEWDYRVEKLFVTSKVNPAGIFSANIFVRGIAMVYSVDDYIPYTPKGKTA